MAVKLEDRWQSFRKEVLDSVHNRALVEKMKLAFYAGASVVLVHGVPAPAVEGEGLTAAEAEQLNVFWAELVATVTTTKPN